MDQPGSLQSGTCCTRQLKHSALRLQPWVRGVPTPPLASPATCALQVLRQKRLYEGQRDQLYQQQFNVEQTAFAMTSMQARRQGLCFCGSGGW